MIRMLMQKCNRVKRAFIAGLVGIVFALPALCSTTAGDSSSEAMAFAQWPQSLHMADFILSLQRPDGAIVDEAGVRTVNQDSNMEYALIGLGAAYATTRNAKYLDGFEKGIHWLAQREEMNDPLWKGSWYYVFSANSPNHIPTSPGRGITDARGVDATSTLFAYLLYLDRRLTGSSALADTYEANGRAALDFVIRRNLDSDGFSQSSWHLYAADKRWHLYTEKYSADQGDVYLGMYAGELLYHDARYARVAESLRCESPARFFSSSKQRYGLGIHSGGRLDTKDDGNSAGFSQGYLAWMWGDGVQNRAALKWLRSQVQSNGSIISVPGKPAYSLNVAMLALAAKGLQQPQPVESLRWLINTTYDPKTGGVRHSPAAGDNHEFNNEAAFCLLAYLGFLPFE